MIVRTFDANSAARGVLGHLGSLLRFPGLVWRNRFMVHNFLRRDLMSRAHGSFLGLGWILLQPLFMFAIYFLAFGVLFARQDVTSLEQVEYAVYLFSGIIVFHAVIEATTQACTTIVDNGNLVKKVAFPSEALLVHISVVALVIYLVGALVVVVAGAVLGVSHPNWRIALLPVTLVVQFTLTLGIGLLLANLYVFVRDIAQLWRLATMAWMFLSPVFWDTKQMRVQLGEDVTAVLLTWNPLSALLQVQRMVLGGPEEKLGPFWPQLGIAAAWATFFLVVGYAVFMSRKHKYADLI